ncbi:MAG: hypothetical protein IT305_15795 [Chloroflexi bacterium]|nr:hypothetical protein [Chloroflexota bacterium]
MRNVWHGCPGLASVPPFWSALELGVSIAASAVVALMVLAGGMALEMEPSDVIEASVMLDAEKLNPLVVCREDREGVRCIPEAS